MNFFAKYTATILLILIALIPSVTTSANIIDDIQNGFKDKKSKVTEKAKNLKTQAELDQDEQRSNLNKICEISKGYAVKHYSKRQENRGKEIEQNLSGITKIKNLLASSKVDLSQINQQADNLIKLLKQKKTLLAERVKNSGEINCKGETENEGSREKTKINNTEIAKLDKEITRQQRDFGLAARILIQTIKEKAKEVKPEEAK
jgi:hypothetical protein